MLRLYSTFLILTGSFISVNNVSVIKNNETLITEMLLKALGPWPTNRPVLDPTTVVNVNLSFVLTQIIELQWEDEHISWDASKYGVNCVTLPVESIWKPDLTLYNNIDEEYNQFPPNAPVVVCSNGSAVYSTYAIFRSSCHIHIQLFPYDNQTCTLRFASWIYDVYELDVRPELRTADQNDQFDDHGVWYLLGVDGKREVVQYKTTFNPYVHTVFYIHLSRRHEFQLLFILIPYFFCSFLICLMFFVPFESGEKISYGITAVLGMIVFQEIIAFSLPPVGNESSFVGKYFTSVFCIGIISVFVEITVYNIYMQGNVYTACMFVLNWYRTQTRVASNGPINIYEMGETEEPQIEQGNTTTASSATEHIIKLRRNCAIFDFCFGVLCLTLLLILMMWFANRPK
ncbi:neuronal acetylcholine receptor subunit alpha-10-like isoform X2 [Anneissia japonica]|uniref:neuronal acetylcholine receptor subunit alpha-10-like isoform X2 n=1 Tax=Anneissia japonica TaxID=1529436 RepID=UPI001425B50A|nr:neuronal acetylcholine receptor subunit alpha-10-like isoform X2 [Anneissia japonica]